MDEKSRAKLFRFHTGSIKSPVEEVEADLSEGVFRFHTGSIKRWI